MDVLEDLRESDKHVIGVVRINGTNAIIVIHTETKQAIRDAMDADTERKKNK